MVTALLTTLLLIGGGVGVARAQRVRTPAMLTATLAERVVALELDSRVQASLLAQLHAGQQAFEEGNVTAGVGTLRAFQHNVWAYGRGANSRLFVYDANELSAEAQIVVNVALNAGLLLGGNQLTYIGGSILAHPKVFITFWGPDWQDLSIDFDNANVYGFLPGFLEQIGGTPYMETLTQYYQENANGSKTYISNDSSIVKGTWIDPQSYPNSATQVISTNPDGSITTFYDLSDDEIHKEVLRAISHFGFDPDAIYFIATDGRRYWNSNLKNASAYHSSFQSPPLALSPAYAELPYNGIVQLAQGLHDTFPFTQGNWTLSYASSVSLLAFHELAEAITDPRYGDNPATSTPFPSNYGWVSFDNLEIADRCGDIVANDPAVFTIGIVPFLVPQLWSNDAFGCVAMTP
jgi:hypothetical protein